jgi:Spy/CpxP family protein refolding chaperone
MRLESPTAHASKMIAVFIVLAAACPLPAADAPGAAADPLAGAFFPPELIVLARDRMTLTPEQRNAFRDRVEKTRLRGDELRARLERETAALAAIAKQERVDEAALGAQLDKVLDVEREAKHLRLGLLAAIKNLLTADQQAQLRSIGKDGHAKLAEDARKQLTERVEHVQQIARAWADSGRDPSFIAKTMTEKIKPLIEAGNVMDAEAELDRLIEQLQRETK